MARLQITSFLILHSLNLVSTLTTQSAITRHHSTNVPSPYETVAASSPIFSVNLDSPVVAPLLAQLVSSQAPDVDIIARVSAPAILVLVDSASGATGTRSALAAAALNASGGNSDAHSASTIAMSMKTGHGKSSLAVLDSFMSGWTVIVGDPVISKWLSLALGISIFLNAYLLKGIATGNAAVAERNAAGAAAYAAARMIGAHLNGSEEFREQAKNANLTRGWKGGNLEGLKPPPRDKSVNGSEEMLSAYHKRLAAASASRAGQPIVQLAHEGQRLDVNGGDANVGSPKVHKPIPISAKAIDTDAGAAVRSLQAADVPASSEGEGAVARPSQRNGHLRMQTATYIAPNGEHITRPFEECVEVYAGGAGIFLLSDEEVILLAQKGKIASYALEKTLQDHERAVRIRRALVSRASATRTLETSELPHSNYNYAQVMGACCENVVGYMPLPVGIAGPLNIDGQVLPIPMATTEGTLVASTSRGCKALNAGGGVTTVLTQDAMTRGPAIEFPSITSAARAKRWLDSQEGASIIKASFDSTSRFARLSSLKCAMAGRTLFVRFATATGDAMGMNMISKGVERALGTMIEDHFPEMRVLSLSGNYCTDKKPAAINWIEGRGKSVVAEAVIPGAIVKSVLKTTVQDLVNLNTKKNLIGSAMAGSVGGFNAHAANILTAIFLATGQDPAQNVESSNCMTLMEPVNDGLDLLVTCSMPSIEVGTVGGGTVLGPQQAMLKVSARRALRCAAARPQSLNLPVSGSLSPSSSACADARRPRRTLHHARSERSTTRARHLRKRHGGRTVAHVCVGRWAFDQGGWRARVSSFTSHITSKSFIS